MDYDYYPSSFKSKEQKASTKEINRKLFSTLYEKRESRKQENIDE